MSGYKVGVALTDAKNALKSVDDFAENGESFFGLAAMGLGVGAATAAIAGDSALTDMAIVGGALTAGIMTLSDTFHPAHSAFQSASRMKEVVDDLNLGNLNPLVDPDAMITIKDAYNDFIENVPDQGKYAELKEILKEYIALLDAKKPIEEINKILYEKYTQCFSKGTLIERADGSYVAIEGVKIGDEVSAFYQDLENGNIIIGSGRVVRIFHGLTSEFVSLTILGKAHDGHISKEKELIVTPGHRFLNSKGEFEAIGSILAAGNGVADIIWKDGTTACAAGKLIAFSEETAHLFEQGEQVVYSAAGALATQPEVVRGWKTYNFEVAEYHTYIAEGICVHNISASWAHDNEGLVDRSRYGEESYAVTYTGRRISVDQVAIDSFHDAHGGGRGGYADSKMGRAETAAHGAAAKGHSRSDVTAAAYSEGISAGLDPDSVSTVSGISQSVDRAQSSAKGSGGGKPIIIDLDGDGIEILPQNRNLVTFDFDDDGHKQRTAWVAADDGFLMFDEGNDGRLSRAREIVLADWTSDPKDTDLQALKAVFDSNRDGRLNSLDAQWSSFKIWQDSNSNAVIDAGELKTLATLGIKELGLNPIYDKPYFLTDGSVVNSFIDVVRTAANGSQYLTTGADVTLKYAKDGLQIVNGIGVTEYRYQSGLVEKVKNLLDGERNYTVTNTSKDPNNQSIWIGAIGNGLDNSLSSENSLVHTYLEGGAGNDSITGGYGNDILVGGAGVDRIFGGDGDDTLFVDTSDMQSTPYLGVKGPRGGAGYDTLVVVDDVRYNLNLSTNGFEAVVGGGGDDEFTASLGGIEYRMSGGAGNDVLRSNSGADFLNGEDGNDQLQGGDAGDWLIGGGGNDELYGEGGADLLAGGDDGDTLDGGGADDILRGEGKNDTLLGGDGNDRLVGGVGSDRLDGGSGSDTAEFIALNGAKGDIFSYAGQVYALSTSDRSLDTILNVENLTDGKQTIASSRVDMFDGLNYAASYNDVGLNFGQDVGAAFWHYTSYGFFEGREAGGFDPAQYLRNYGDVAAYGTTNDALTRHFLQFGLSEHRLAENPLTYVASFGDLIHAYRGNSAADIKANGLNHYKYNGFSEGRRDRVDFDVNQYLQNNTDVAAAFGNDKEAATLHFIKYGYLEHRLADDPLTYVASNTDILRAFGGSGSSEASIKANALSQYQSRGHAEGRITDSFEVDQYLANYEELRAAYIDGNGGYNEDAATLHFIQYGYFEGRTDDVLTA